MKMNHLTRLITIFWFLGGSLSYAEPRQRQIAKDIADIDLTNIQLTIYSVNPEKQSRSETTDKKHFHSYRILGSALITQTSEKTLLLKAFSQGIRENSSEIAMCFNPRHGLRLIKNSKTIDFLICFQCRQVYSYGFPDKQFLISESPSALFNQILQTHRIKLAPK